MKCILPFLIALALPLSAATDPGTAALQYLAKVREKKVDGDTGKGTAISAETTDDKRKEIAKAIERLSKELADGALELGEVKQDGVVASVIVRQIKGFDVESMQVIALAMVLHGDEWLPAPIPASFDNTGLAYDPVLSKKLPALEEWMLRQRVLDLQNLRAESTRRMQRQIEASLPKDKLAAMKPGEMVKGFTEACARQDLSAILGYLGGHNRTLPDNWSVRIKSITEAVLKKQSVDGPWRLLLSPEVFQLAIHADMEDDSGTVSFACLDPREKATAFVILHLELSKSEEGLWQMDLPPAFYNSDINLPENDDLDSDLLATLPGRIRGEYPAAPQASAEEAHKLLLAEIQKSSIRHLLPLIAWDGSDPESALKAMIKAAQLWRALHDPVAVGFPLELAFHESGDEAALICQFFSTRDPERTDIRTLQFQKSGQGWLWNPSPLADPDSETDGGKIAKWIQDERPGLMTQWQTKLLAVSCEVKAIGENHAVAEDEARKLLTEWISALHEGNVEKALALTAWVNDGRGTSRLLRNLGHEMATARKEGARAEIENIYHSPHWMAVGVKSSSEDTPANFPFYPVIQTDKGARILLEVDLFVPAARGRDFLNKASLERLQAISTPALSDDLAKLLEDYKKAVLK